MTDECVPVLFRCFVSATLKLDINHNALSPVGIHCIASWLEHIPPGTKRQLTYWSHGSRRAEGEGAGSERALDHSAPASPGSTSPLVASDSPRAPAPAPAHGHLSALQTFLDLSKLAEALPAPAPGRSPLSASARREGAGDGRPPVLLDHHHHHGPGPMFAVTQPYSPPQFLAAPGAPPAPAPLPPPPPIPPSQQWGPYPPPPASSSSGLLPLPPHPPVGPAGRQLQPPQPQPQPQPQPHPSSSRGPQQWAPHVLSLPSFPTAHPPPVGPLPAPHYSPPLPSHASSPRVFPGGYSWVAPASPGSPPGQPPMSTCPGRPPVPPNPAVAGSAYMLPPALLANLHGIDPHLIRSLLASFLPLQPPPAGPGPAPLQPGPSAGSSMPPQAPCFPGGRPVSLPPPPPVPARTRGSLMDFGARLRGRFLPGRLGRCRGPEPAAGVGRADPTASRERPAGEGVESQLGNLLRAQTQAPALRPPPPVPAAPAGPIKRLPPPPQPPAAGPPAQPELTLGESGHLGGFGPPGDFSFYSSQLQLGPASPASPLWTASYSLAGEPTTPVLQPAPMEGPPSSSASSSAPAKCASSRLPEPLQRALPPPEAHLPPIAYSYSPPIVQPPAAPGPDDGLGIPQGRSAS
ncbi:hypothetical protein PAPYR_6146 [Paratrimastix pyriformis]|uniref:Uncharacterized protein n=1 Tax=Paratrimastix pyriformis TaxID=342808 RepID=A0ABQ8UFZ3_9EUKA|nr:hypothetical protein PAPYR_6146 [Paratrimastix pyriformis]